MKDDAEDDAINVDTDIVDVLGADALVMTTLRHDKGNDDNLRTATVDRRDPTAAATAFMMFLFVGKGCDKDAFC